MPRRSAQIKDVEVAFGYTSRHNGGDDDDDERGGDYNLYKLRLDE